MGIEATVESVLPPYQRSAPEPWWLRALPRRVLLVVLALVPLLTPVFSPQNDGPFIYPYCAAMHLLSAWFCWKAALRYPSEKVRWQTVVVAQCVHAVAYVVAAQQGVQWISHVEGAWLANGCVAVCWVLYLPALMGVRSVRGSWVSSLDYLLAVVTSGLMMQAMGSGKDPANGWSRIIVVLLAVAVVTAAAFLAKATSTRPGIKLFSSVVSTYMMVSLLVYFLLSIVNLYWIPRPHILGSDMVISFPELLLCELAVNRQRPAAVHEQQYEPVLVDSLQSSMMAMGAVLLALYGFRAHALIAGAAVMIIVFLYVLRTQLFYHRLFVQQRELRMLATRDALTGVGNRRWFDDEAAKLLLADRSYPCSMMLVDTDRFKEVNDTFGHPLGDEVLRGVAAALSEVTAQVKRGCCARIGGDEFGALWPGTSAQQALLLAEEFRARVEAKVFPSSLRATVSVGVATTDKALPLLKLMRGADVALYRAKAAGRNVVREIDLAMFSEDQRS